MILAYKFDPMKSARQSQVGRKAASRQTDSLSQSGVVTSGGEGMYSEAVAQKRFQARETTET